MKVTSPLVLTLPRKRVNDVKFTLNLNTYRNTFYATLNEAKIHYKDIITSQIQKLPVMEQSIAVYTLYPKTKRLCDTANICAIHEKFFMDALVSAGKLPDDNYKYHLKTSYLFGKVDKHNPRVEIDIYPITNSKFRQLRCLLWLFLRSLNAISK